MFALLEKFWPECPYAKCLITDLPYSGCRFEGFDGVSNFVYPSDMSWSQILASFAKVGTENEICLFQEDFFLNAPVQQHLIEHALEQMKERNAGCVRLYPCPGGEVEYGDPYFAIVPRGAPYRVSCQASIYRPDYLHKIASRFNTPAEFELQGTPFSDTLSEEVLAFKREVTPYPLSYLVSAVTRGKWEPAAMELCNLHGISVDWSQRPFTDDRVLSCK